MDDARAEGKRRKGIPAEAVLKSNGEQGECHLGPFLPGAIPTRALVPLLLIGRAF